MSAKNIEEVSEKLFLKFVGSNTEKQAILFEEINRELEAFLTKESNDKDATDVLDLLLTIYDSVQEEFDKLISGDRKEVCQDTVKYICIKHKGQHCQKN